MIATTTLYESMQTDLLSDWIHFTAKNRLVLPQLSAVLLPHVSRDRKALLHAGL